MISEMRWKGLRPILVLLLGMLSALALSGSPPASFLNRAAHDSLLGFTVVPRTEPRVAVIGVDDAALSRFPEPIAMWHPHWAAVLEGICRTDARAIAMDMVFAVSLETIAPDLDRRFMEALKLCKNRNLPVYMGVATGPFARMPRPEFAMFSSGLGFLNLSADSDEVIRRQILMQTNSAGKRLMALSRLLIQTEIPPEYSEETGVYIDFRHPPPPVYPFSDVHEWAVNGRSDKLSKAFDGKFVLLGFVSPILQDLHTVPRSAAPAGRETIPGVHIHARIAQTLFAGNLLRDAPFLWTAGFCLVLGAISCIAFLRCPPLAALGVAGAGILAGGFGVFHAFRSGVVLPAGSLLCFAVVPGFTTGLLQYVSENRRRRVLQDYFGKYVHPRVVEDILKSPRRIDFKGESVVVTVMFADIRNFTTLCERREPAEVLQGLNRYFESMNAAIDSAGGYLNRTLGDGILALFGAPFPLADDGAWAAVRCGLDMLHRMESLNREPIFPDAGPLRIGIGIHTGRAIVGNVGSFRKLEYTIVGDTANLASRIESLTKTYHVPFLSSGETLSRVGDRVKSRYLDTTRVKGRDQQVSVYVVEGIGDMEKGEK